MKPVAFILGLVLLAAPLAAAEDDSITFGSFGKVVLSRPEGPPRAVVLFVSGDGGWNLGVVDMARRVQGLGAVVAGIDMRTLQKNLEASSRKCVYPAGDFEELSRAVQLHLKLPRYQRPILVGYSSGATLVYGLLAQAPPETFAGGISLGFCPDLEVAKPLCSQRVLTTTPRKKGPGLDLGVAPNLGVPWFVLQGEIDQVCDPPSTRTFVGQIQSATLFSLPHVGHGFSVTRNWDPQFVSAFKALSTSAAPPPPSPNPVAPDLSVVEVEAASGTSGDTLAILLTGDGGWAEIDKGIADAVAADGVPVIGWSSLEYYWTPRTPERAAQDLDTLIRHYLAAKKKDRVVLIGFSFGADVLPFLASRLSAEVRSKIAGLALVGLSKHAQFEFHISGWLGGDGDPAFPTAPEVTKLQGTPVVCLQGEDDDASACRAIGAGLAKVVVLPGGHHLGGDYARVGAIILDSISKRTP